jgi:hypothetical protein
MFKMLSNKYIMLMTMMTLRYAQCVDSGDTVTDQVRCFGFDFEAYERYDEYFREDSVLVLAQAGRYTGPADIEECPVSRYNLSIC